MKVARIEVVEDRTERSRCDEGFLRLRRLRVRNVLEDGSRSEPYDCDVMSRRDVDAVTVVLFEVDGERRVRVALKSGVRPPVALRGEKRVRHAEAEPFVTVTETVAGVLEEQDEGPGGVERRAAAECLEECGVEVPPEAVRPLGAALFPSPGVTDERVHFRAAAAPMPPEGPAPGDGSPMEAGTQVVVLEVGDAIERCRRGEIPDMKTEVALLRLCDAIGYLPQLGRFADDLEDELASGYRRLGLDRVPRP